MRYRKGWLIPLVAALVCVSLVACLVPGCAEEGEAPSETAEEGGAEVVLIFDGYMAPGALLSLEEALFMDLVEERSQGRITFDRHWGGALSSGPEVLESVASGSTQVGQFWFNYNTAEFPLSQGLALTFVEENIDAALRGIKELYDTYDPYRREFEQQNVRLLYPHSPGTHAMWCSDRVANLDALEGKKVRCTSYDAVVVDWFGAEAVGLGYGECYVAMERGVIDVWWDAPLGTGHATKNYEVGPYVADVGSGMWAAITPVINLDVWNDLPADLQRVIDDCANEAYEDALDLMDDYEREAVDDMVENDLAEPVVWSDAEKVKAKEIVQPELTELWLEETEAKTEADAEAFIQKYRDLVDKYAAQSEWQSPYDYWLEQL